MKSAERVLEVDIFRVDAVGLISWEFLVVLFEDLNNVHRSFTIYSYSKILTLTDVK